MDSSFTGGDCESGERLAWIEVDQGFRNQGPFRQPNCMNAGLNQAFIIKNLDDYGLGQLAV